MNHFQNFKQMPSLNFEELFQWTENLVLTDYDEKLMNLNVILISSAASRSFFLKGARPVEENWTIKSCNKVT